MVSLIIFLYFLSCLHYEQDDIKIIIILTTQNLISQNVQVRFLNKRQPL